MTSALHIAPEACAGGGSKVTAAGVRKVFSCFESLAPAAERARRPGRVSRTELATGLRSWLGVRCSWPQFDAVWRGLARDEKARADGRGGRGAPPRVPGGAEQQGASGLIGWPTFRAAFFAAPENEAENNKKKSQTPSY